MLQLKEKPMRHVNLIGLLLLAGCASTGIRSLRPNELATAPYHERGGQSLVGSLMYEGGCLLFEDEDKTTRILPVWPSGSTFEESLITFHRPGKAEQRVMVGEEINLHGETVEWAAVPDPRLAPFEHQCGAKLFFVTAMAPAN